MVALKIAVICALFLGKHCAAQCPSFNSEAERRPVYPGEELAFYCSIPHDVILWPINPTETLFVSQGSMTASYGPFTAHATGNDGSCYYSNLTVTVSPELNGSVIMCTQNSGEVAGTATIIVESELGSEVSLLYNDQSELLSFEVKWNALSPELEYSVLYTCGGFNLSRTVPCENVGECTNTLDIPGLPEASQQLISASQQCSASVSVEMLEEQLVFSTIISDVLQVELPVSYPAIATCSVLSGGGCCRVTATYNNGDSSVTRTSPCVAPGESVELELPVPPETSFSYFSSLVDCGCDQFQQSVTTGQTSALTGRSVCTAVDLCETGSDIKCNDPNTCSSDDGTRGFVSYNTSLVTGVLAYYTCCDGFELSGNGVLECQSNGVWNSSSPACYRIPETLTTAVIILIIVVVIVAVLALVFLALLIVFAILYCKGKNKIGGHQDLKSTGMKDYN